jgi:hypothetical protein
MKTSRNTEVVFGAKFRDISFHEISYPPKIHGKEYLGNCNINNYKYPRPENILRLSELCGIQAGTM